MEKSSFDDVCSFIIKLGERIHGYGPNSNNIEFSLKELTKVLGYHGVFNSTPKSIHFAFSEDGKIWQKTHVSEMDGSGTELNKLAHVGDVLADLKAGKLTVVEADERLDQIDKLPHPWGNVTSALSYIMCGVAFPVLMSGTWMDLILSGIFSLVVFFMVTWLGYKGSVAASWIPFSTAFVAGILAGISRYYFSEVSVVLIVLSSVLILIPGYGISVGVIEIVMKNINSGLINLVGGLTYLFKQFIGGWLGVSAVGLILSIPYAAKDTTIGSEWLWLFIPVIIVGLGIALQTPYRDFFWACLAMLIAYLGTLIGGDMVGSNFGNLLGTILLVVFTNIWARKTGRPSSIVMVPAFILLVSGSVGFRGLAAMSQGNIQTGGEQFMQMFVVALTLAAGLVIGTTIIASKKS